MKIEKVINNNIITSYNEQGKEIIAMGRGLGFGKRPGDEISKEQVQKVFLIADEAHSARFKALLEKIPIEHLKISDEIITFAKQQLNTEFCEEIYVALTDHINFAIERHNKNIHFRNALLWEIKRFYPREYQVGLDALKIIEKRLGIVLDEDEAASIALHIVNADLDADMQQSISMTKVIQGVLNIVKYYYKKEFDQNSISYERFITHLKFFIQRVYSKHCYEEDDPVFIETIKKQYPEAYKCALKIKEYIRLEMEYELGDEELVYLTVHIQRITK